MNEEECEKERASLHQEHKDLTKQLTGKLESQYLMDTAETMTRLKYKYNDQIKNLHKGLEDMYRVKLSNMQKKHSNSWKQLMNATSKALKK